MLLRFSDHRASFLGPGSRWRPLAPALLFLPLLGALPATALPLTLSGTTRTITARADTVTNSDTTTASGLYTNTVSAFSSPLTVTSIQNSTITVSGPGDLLTATGSGSTNGVRPTNPGNPGVMDGSLSTMTIDFVLTQGMDFSLAFDYTIVRNNNQQIPAVNYAIGNVGPWPGISGSFTSDGSGSVLETGVLGPGTYTFTLEATVDGSLANLNHSPATALWNNLAFSVSVPEPATPLYLVIAGLIPFRRRRRASTPAGR